MRSSTVASSESLTLITLMLRADFAQTPDMCGELSSVEGVTAEEGEDTAGSVVSAVHTLRLQLQVKLQRSVHHHLSQGGLPFERSWAKRICLRSHVNVEPVVCFRLADLQGGKPVSCNTQSTINHIKVFRLSTFFPELLVCLSMLYLVTHDLFLCIAQQRGCCFISEPLIFFDSEVRCVHTARFTLNTCGRVV